MLVLSRKSQECVVVGGSAGSEPMLKVTVLEIRGGSVRLGFEAPAEIPVHRWEVWERIRAAGGPDPPACRASAVWRVRVSRGAECPGNWRARPRTTCPVRVSVAPLVQRVLS
jgi:carbon storage regulator